MCTMSSVELNTRQSETMNMDNYKKVNSMFRLCKESLGETKFQLDLDNSFRASFALFF